MCMHLVRLNMQMSFTMDITNLQKFKNWSDKGLETGARCTNFQKNIAFRMIMGHEIASWALQPFKFLPAFELLNKLNLKSQLGKLAVPSFLNFYEQAYRLYMWSNFEKDHKVSVSSKPNKLKYAKLMGCWEKGCFANTYKIYFIEKKWVLLRLSNTYTLPEI